METARKIELTIYALLTVGVIFIFNSSIVHSQNVFGDPHRFFILHLGWLVISLIAFKIFSRINVSNLIKLSPIAYFTVGILLVFLAIWGILPCSMSTSFAPCINNANRWLVLNPAPLFKIPFLGELGFQPSELAKITLILFLAYKIQEKVSSRDALRPFKAYLIYTSIYTGLVFLEPNMSTGLLLFAIGTSMYYSSGHKLSPFVYLVPLLLVLFIFMVLGSSYRRQRLMTYINHSQTEQHAEEGYQIKQVKIALGSGGFFGVGFGNSRQKYTYLPEVSTDSIFAIIGEEFGFIGTIVILAGFIYLLMQCFQLARATSDYSLKLVVIGVTNWLGIQILIHMSANSGLIPYTGVPLPFISYGGSSLLFSMIAMGTLISISRTKR